MKFEMTTEEITSLTPSQLYFMRERAMRYDWLIQQHQSSNPIMRVVTASGEEARHDLSLAIDDAMNQAAR